MALPDQNMQEAIEESKEKIQQMAAHNSSAFAKYVPQPKTDLEYVVHDLQMALKRAEQERLEHERRVSELSAKVMSIQNKEGTPVNQDILNSLQARLSRIESAGLESAGLANGGSGAQDANSVVVTVKSEASTQAEADRAVQIVVEDSGATLGRRLEQEDATISCNSELLAAQETIAQQAATIAELKAQLKAD